MDFFGLREICKYLNLEFEYNFSIESIVYFIRQVSICDGCINFCSHCFASSPKRAKQMTLESFSRIIGEIGSIVSKNGEPLKFFHLGASTDPAAVKNYSDYLRCWINSFPEWQRVKLFTHGWNLENGVQKLEFNSLVTYLQTLNKENFIFVLSFDEFSLFARKDWQKYLKNLSCQLTVLLSILPLDRIRFEVFYTPERNHCSKECTLEYWRQRIAKNRYLSFFEIENEILKFKSCDDFKCSKVTLGILNVLKMSNIQVSDIPVLTRDYGAIYPSGRGKSFFNTESDVLSGLDMQEKRVLLPLQNYKYKCKGLIVNPNGGGYIVNYRGFNNEGWLNKGEKIVPYIDYFTIDG